MKTSEAFKIAKTHLWDGRGRDNPRKMWICVCISIAAQEKKIPLKDANRCRGIISALLGNYCTLSSWLMREHDIENPHANKVKLQATRAAWLDHLIDHYQSIGD